ncbi:hypothetical protein DFW101_2819 [Solidesulfovibrio carbinoliphilus subsp. oakridgensis]|uniref:Uncharacterized protein n=1 Tax=Solidesulfovibrio carbinoliphilus subsp. oakridgensis TaxID=694327 RepID=G7QB81_9BACT|nr:hypothetical protein [Solidesulfovibrio carbinoliphilus]EHJ48823.1 hypothetical protein DFW101_2819 [Solidesulfovibrio carbinoliphilus subsp. oakridgensis]
MEREILARAARAVDAQASEDPSLGVPVDPDVADFMGAFEEKAVGLDDLDEIQGNEGEGGHGA